MVNLLIGIHAALGEVGVIAFLWVFVELLNPNLKRVKRAKQAAFIGVLFLFLSWLVGGYYYVNFYGASVKPIIKEGPMPWAHDIFMEVKEHVFLFLPFLSLMALGLIKKYEKDIIKGWDARKAVLLISLLIVLIGMMMAGMGYIISSGARAALEAGA